MLVGKGVPSRQPSTFLGLLLNRSHRQLRFTKSFRGARWIHFRESFLLPKQLLPSARTRHSPSISRDTQPTPKRYRCERPCLARTHRYRSGLTPFHSPVEAHFSAACSTYPSQAWASEH